MIWLRRQEAAEWISRRRRPGDHCPVGVVGMESAGLDVAGTGEDEGHALGLAIALGERLQVLGQPEVVVIKMCVDVDLFEVL